MQQSKLPIPSSGTSPGVYDPLRTEWNNKVGKMNEKGQVMLVDGTLVETQRPSWPSAARMGDIDLVNTYIEEMQGNPKGIDFTEPNGYTCLSIGATYNQLELVKMLIARGADVNVQNTWMDTALHRAGEQGFAEMVQLLLNHGADPLLEDWRGQRAYEYAKNEGHTECMRIFREDKQAHPDKYKKLKLHQMPLMEQPETSPKLAWQIAEENKLGVYATGGPKPADAPRL